MVQVKGSIKYDFFDGNASAHSQSYSLGVSKIKLAKDLELAVDASVRNRSPHELNIFGQSADEVKSEGGTQNYKTSLSGKDDLGLRKALATFTYTLDKDKKEISRDEEKKKLAILEDKTIIKLGIGSIQNQSFAGKPFLKLFQSDKAPKLLRPGSDPYALGFGLSLNHSKKVKKYDLDGKERTQTGEKKVGGWHLGFSAIRTDHFGFEGWGKKNGDDETKKVEAVLPFSDKFNERSTQLAFNSCWWNSTQKFCIFVLNDDDDKKGGTGATLNYQIKDKFKFLGEEFKAGVAANVTGFSAKEGDLPPVFEGGLHAGFEYAISKFIKFQLQTGYTVLGKSSTITIDPDGGFTDRDESFDNIDGVMIDASPEDINERYGNEEADVFNLYSMFYLNPTITTEIPIVAKDFKTGRYASFTASVGYNSWWEEKESTTSREEDDQPTSNSTYLSGLIFSSAIKFAW